MSPTPTISIRTAGLQDEQRVARLAALDSAPAPAGPALLAEVDGQLRAALALRDGAVVADPFAPTAELVSLLRVRADALAGRTAGQRRERQPGFARRLGLAA